MTRERLPRSWRLVRRSDLRAVLYQGRRFGTHLIELFWKENGLGHPRLALVVPRFRQTVVSRNRLKRRLREIARRAILPKIPPLDLVVRAKAEAYSAKVADLKADLEKWAGLVSG